MIFPSLFFLYMLFSTLLWISFAPFTSPLCNKNENSWQQVSLPVAMATASASISRSHRAAECLWPPGERGEKCTVDKHGNQISKLFIQTENKQKNKSRADFWFDEKTEEKFYEKFP